MSQAKVDKYKAEKVNRKANVKKQKASHALRVTLAAVICIVCVGYVGFSAYNSIKGSKTIDSAEINVEDLTDYLDGIGE